jgi:hypothetical protein
MIMYGARGGKKNDAEKRRRELRRLQREESNRGKSNTLAALPSSNLFSTV